MNQRAPAKKIILVNRDFQLRYTGAGLVASCASTFITATLILYPLYAFKILTIGVFLPWPIFLGMGFAVVLNILVQMAFGIVLTHKIAGPMFSLIKNIRKIGAGQWNVKMRQRPGDELQMVVRHFNELSESLVKTVNSELAQLESIKDVIESLDCAPTKKEILLTSVTDLSHQLSDRIKLPKSVRSENQ